MATKKAQDKIVLSFFYSYIFSHFSFNTSFLKPQLRPSMDAREANENAYREGLALGWYDPPTQ